MHKWFLFKKFPDGLFLINAAYGNQFPNQGSNPCPLHWKFKVLTAEPLGILKWFLIEYQNSRCLNLIFTNSLQVHNGNSHPPPTQEWSRIWRKPTWMLNFMLKELAGLLHPKDLCLNLFLPPLSLTSQSLPLCSAFPLSLADLFYLALNLSMFWPAASHLPPDSGNYRAFWHDLSLSHFQCTSQIGNVLRM